MAPSVFEAEHLSLHRRELLMSTSNLVPLDFDAADLRVTPCRYCPAWWAEVVPGPGPAVVREWHRRGCPVAEELAAPEDVEAPAEDPSTEQAVGALMGVYGLDAQTATNVLLLRASVVALSLGDLASRIVALAPRLGIEESTRRRVSGLLDTIG